MRLAHPRPLAQRLSRYVANHVLHRAHTQCLENDPQQPPPEDLLSRLAASPVLLTIVSVYIPPTDLLDLLTTHWLDRIEDESARAEDPQASLIRFGSGVVLAEAVCALFDVSCRLQVHRN